MTLGRGRRQFSRGGQQRTPDGRPASRGRRMQLRPIRNPNTRQLGPIRTPNVGSTPQLSNTGKSGGLFNLQSLTGNAQNFISTGISNLPPIARARLLDPHFDPFFDDKPITDFSRFPDINSFADRPKPSTEPTFIKSVRRRLLQLRGIDPFFG